MAFSFGSSTPSFGASSTSAFGASSTPAFSFSSTPAFGTPSSAPAFGAPSSTPAFGAASSTPAFSFSTPAAGQTAAQSSAAPSFGGFGVPQQQQALQQAVAFTQATKFEELDKNTQQQLAAIQEQISKYEQDRLKVQQLEHLQDPTALRQDLNADITSLSSELKQLQATIKAEQDSLTDFREKAIRLLKSTEIVVRTYERSKLWREAVGAQRQEALKPAQQELLAQPVVLPGPFLGEAVAGFSSKCSEYSRCLEEVEQVLAASTTQDLPAGSVDWVLALPTILANMHDYFVATAAKLEKTHGEVHKAKSAYLARLRARGITVDPFERAHRQEQQLQAAQQQRAAATAATGFGQAAVPALPTAGAGGAAVGTLPLPASAASPPAGNRVPCLAYTNLSRMFSWGGDLPCVFTYLLLANHAHA
eukprot:GHUV01008207.1.p1 GENE.GHUV01008207.1~~GHUV01008207.1.p1  ORF type:complete len:420 (+),score=172.21 GHUV01008207.1:205-1464(+)